MIKAIAFDYGGVIEITEKGLIQKIADYLQITTEDWEKEYMTLNYLCNTGQKSYKEVYGLVARKFNAGEAQVSHIKEMMDENQATRKMNLELIEIIKDLKDKNYKVGLLSNNLITLRNKLKEDGLINLFDSIVISSEVGYQKPRPEIFEILFKELNVASNELIFIDDNESSLIGAEQIGYTPILYIDNEQLKSDLSKNLVRIN